MASTTLGLTGNTKHPSLWSILREIKPQTRPGITRLAIYGLRGMLVRDLLDEELTASPHRHCWGGRDRGGRDLVSGSYLDWLVTPDGRRVNA